MYRSSHRTNFHPVLRFLSMIVCLVIVGCAQTVFGQTKGGTLRGTVKDPQGAIVRGGHSDPDE
jgi:hypothetical protein